MAIQQRTGTNPVKVNPEKFSSQTLLRLQRMARELRLTDQILSFDVDSLSIVETGPAPAWTSADGESITINLAQMPMLNKRIDVAIWLGTNAHELFHNLFSPRSTSLLMRRISAAENSTERGIYRSWNVIEDQRIERLGLARYAPWRGYLIAALAHHIPVDHPQSWTLLAGRTWLSDEARSIARTAFVATNGEADAKRCAELIGAYQRLVDPGEADAVEAYDIVAEFHGLFGSSLPPRGGCGGTAGRVKDGEPELNEDDTHCPHPTADEADDDDDDDDDDEPDDDDDDDDDDEPDDGEGDDGDGDKSDDDGDESDDDGEGDDDDGDDESEGDDGDDESEGDDGDDESEGDDGDDESDSDSDEGDDGDGDGADGESDKSDDDDDFDPADGTSGPDGERSITEAIGDDIDEALRDEEVAADLDRIVENLAHGVSGGSQLPRTTGEWGEASDVGRKLTRDVTAVLSDIRDDCEAAWVRRTDTGRFSINRWATEDWDIDNVFDYFDPGAMDASSLDLVLILDISGSMSAQNRTLAEATWAIRHAVDRIEGTVTCIGFGDDASLMFDPTQRPDGRIFLPHLEGSTDPTNALRDAHRIVAESMATNRIVLVLTDGQWWSGNAATQAMQACGAAGAITCVVGLGSSARNYVIPGFAGAQVTAHINDSSELVPIFRTLAEQSMRAAAGR